MDYIVEGIIRAFALIISFDPEVFEVVLTSLRVAFWSTLLATLTGLPLGIMIGLYDFPGRRLTITFFNTLLALPTVVVGLLVYTFISRWGPLGSLDLLFTTKAIIIGGFFLTMPLITALVISAAQSVPEIVKETAVTLGARSRQVAARVIREGRFAILAAIIAGFGRVIAEVGAAMILGGNIKGLTRTMTTAIALEHSKGEFGFALALGFILMLVAFVINILLHWAQGYKK